MDDLFRFLSDMCRESDRPIVLMIDEVDSAGNNQVFVQFLALLRGAYLDRDRTPTFQSVRKLLDESTPLFESTVRHLDSHKELETLIEGILYQGRRIPFNRDEKAINIGVMFGFLKNLGGRVTVANRIFEMRLLNLFVTREAIRSEIYAKGEGDRNQFV